MGCSERQKEIRRRRKRRQQLDHLKGRLAKATQSEERRNRPQTAGHDSRLRGVDRQLEAG